MSNSADIVRPTLAIFLVRAILGACLAFMLAVAGAALLLAAAPSLITDFLH